MSIPGRDKTSTKALGRSVTGANKEVNEAKAKCVWGAETVTSQKGSKL